ncbi:TPA: hypothetical protein U0560_000146 [Streptococcus suis]|uniref:Uncharacterized protein n=1 Tax=Streptococcus suis 6407 TaxID=1214179 RepID=A0A075SEQ9_STRSU|nr:hypothetical protein [Streptococcus suis]AIG43837.1 hypothetical protein ID09_07285 [Streptococcus suis 6407]AIG44376.1 hypothetical protein ID09_10200 [Streptococcus suis 6407]MCK3951546.1 hypothetical protein [Streptococcus suis]MCK4056553.1 hypothetical protein [Streptococcus suis]MDW8584985.1 hypothetical protein [Streptococcus suis]
MNQEQINQALSSAINELTSKLAEELTTKNLLAVQLTAAEQDKQVLSQQNNQLQERVSELEALLDEQTKPEIIEQEGE